MSNRKIWCYWQLFIDGYNRKKFFFFSLIFFAFLTKNLVVTFENISEYESEVENLNYKIKPNMSLWQQKELEGVSLRKCLYAKKLFNKLLQKYLFSIEFITLEY